MTTLPERLQDVIVSFRRLAKDHEIKADRPHQDDSTRQWHMGTSEAYDDAADRLEAAQALQAAPEGGWAVAWLWLLNGKPMNVFLHRPDVEADHWTAKGFSVAPLYASPAQPSGFVLVPVEPTAEMLRAGGCVEPPDSQWQNYIEAKGARLCWALMLTAARAPIEQEG